MHKKKGHCARISQGWCCKLKCSHWFHIHLFFLLWSCCVFQVWRLLFYSPSWGAEGYRGYLFWWPWLSIQGGGVSLCAELHPGDHSFLRPPCEEALWWLLHSPGEVVAAAPKRTVSERQEHDPSRVIRGGSGSGREEWSNCNNRGWWSSWPVLCQSCVNAHPAFFS